MHWLVISHQDFMLVWKPYFSNFEEFSLLFEDMPGNQLYKASPHPLICIKKTMCISEAAKNLTVKVGQKVMVC